MQPPGTALERQESNLFSVEQLDAGFNRAILIKTEVFLRWQVFNIEPFADAKGRPSGKQTIGLLQRRHIRVAQIIYIGKESNNLEEVESGTIHSAQNVYTEYPDPRRDEWQTKILPALKKLPMAALVHLSGKSRSMLARALAGRSRPRLRNRQLLASILCRLGAI